MGKIVKFCGSCEEGFAEKFSFCPNCGGQLAAFEMKPVGNEIVEKENIIAPIPIEPTLVKSVEAPVTSKLEESFVIKNEETPIIETPKIEPAKVDPIIEVPIVATNIEAPTILTNYESTNFVKEEEILQIVEEEPIILVEEKPIIQEEEIWDDIIEEKEPVNATVNVTSGFAATNEYNAMPSSMYRAESYANTEPEDNSYHITVIEDKKQGKRRALLLGFGFVVLTVCSSAWLYSLFAKDLNVGGIGDDSNLFALIPAVEATLVEKEELEKNKDKGGGGGGGGREEQDPVSKGRLASQSEQPLISPTKTIIRRDNPELAQPIATTQGKPRIEQSSDEPYGDPNAQNASRLSDGTGRGGGQGAGNGSGQGNGQGTGRGNGIGSGIGNGRGNGVGNGEGDDGGDGGTPPTIRQPTPRPTPQPTIKPAGVTQDLRILSKPKPGYTDAARQNNVTGTVRLRVTFSANGSIGGITPVSGLPYGLTEQAISAARGIRFEPKKIDGVPQSVTKVVEFGFTIY